MNTKRKIYRGLGVLGVIATTAFVSQVAVGGFGRFTELWAWADSQDPYFDAETAAPEDTLKFPVKDKTQAGPSGSGDTTAANYFDLQDPKNIKKSVEYDTDSNSYRFIEKIGDLNFRNPREMSFDEYYKYRSRQDENEYFNERLEALGMFNQKPDLPALNKEGVFDRLFGGTKLDIKPQGNLTVMAGFFSQNLKNPNIPFRNQKYAIPDFDMMMNVNLVAQIGDKMKLNISNNTLSNFGEMQEMRRLEYTGKEDEIIKKIELGNTSFPLRSTLMPGVSSLFGLKVQTQWGKLWMTNVISQQKSQRKTMTTKGGAMTQDFELQINDYDENKHFLLGQYFFENYDKALAEYPKINSQVMINKVEVWVTNRTGSTQGIRDAMAFMDLGEANPYNATLRTASGIPYPDNKANALYQNLNQNPMARMQSTATQGALSMGLKEGEQFQRVTVRKLNENEFFFQPQLGYVSLLTMTPNPDDVVAVAYRYTYNGEVHQVGEFSEDLPPDSSSQKVIFLKLLKGTAHRVNLPIWDLMMKNVYSLQGMNISKDRFRLNVLYQDPGGGNKRFLPEGPSAGIPIISLLNLDRLNPQNDPFPDGVFDFVEGITINSRNGKIIFPTLEPFGSTLRPALGNDPNLERKYIYQILYDSTKAVAIQQQQNNRFLIKGEFQYSGGGSEIRLNGFNIPQGSVSVSVGGQRLMEGTDYSVDYGMGVVRILNQGLLNSGQPINISYEDNGTFGQTTQSFTGTRLDYYANDKLTLGATYMRLAERPFTQKVTSGYDPIKNTVVGADVNYQSEAPWLTRLVDKLPFYSTSAPSLISGSAEVAGIFPGHSRFVDLNGDEGGTNYVDDFEGASNSYDIRYPANSWSLSSVPLDAVGPTNNILFPEASLVGDLRSGMNRANLSWYNIEPLLNEGGPNSPLSVRNDKTLQDYWRQVQIKEVFPGLDVQNALSILQTFDLNYNPTIRGPYNFDATNVDPATGDLLNPAARWGGIQRALDQSDFEQSNVEYLSFWVLDPFIYNPTSRGGYLYFNLGNVSEDVLKDSRMAFENGITYPKDLSKLDRTIWGYIPKFQQQIVRAFDQDPQARATQDVGYDALNDQEERDEFFRTFLTQVGGVLGTGSPAYQKLFNDPSSDNFKHFYNSDYDQGNAGVLERYRYFNNPQGNSPVLNDNSGSQTSAGTSFPESEDINRDNTLNESEAYYQYRIKMEPNMQVGTNHIVDKRQTTVTLPDKTQSVNTWYQIKIPVKEFDAKIGGISDFRSIRFVRMFMNGFDSQTTLRFARLEFERSAWRRYNFSLINPGENIPEEDQRTTSFGVTNVNVAQNSNKTPIPYKIPPGIQRQLQMATTGQQLRADEQSLALQICGLKDGDARGVFKEFGVNMRQYKQLKMFIHAESVENQPAVRDGDLVAFIRIGSDYVRNYYEYQIPLKVTLPRSNAITAEEIWPEANNMEINLEDLINLKNDRNASSASSALPFQGVDRNGRVIKVIGSPNFGEVKNIMLGVLNPKRTTQNPADDGLAKCVEVWFNELRNAGTDERAGYAATAQLNAQLADLGSVHVGGSMHTKGYGSIDQRVNDRAREDYFSYEGNANLNLGKLFPSKLGLQLPVFAGYSQNTSNPEYDPYDIDVIFQDKLSRYSGSERRALQQAGQDFRSITSFNVNNMRILGNPQKAGKPKPWSVKNFDLNYSYLKQYSRNPLIQSDEFTDQKLGLGYTYAVANKPFEPFKKMIKSKSPWLAFARDFNFNYLPNSFTFRNSLDRTFNETILRNVDDGDYELPPYYYKNFIWNRNYNLRWEFTRSLSLNYQANNISRIDEPYGRINNRSKRDSLFDALSDFGRNTYFTQKVDIAYNLPTSKFPFLSWTTINMVYNANYDWTAASLLTHSQGNIITNTQLKQVNGAFNFTQLYSRSRYLREANKPMPKKSANLQDKMKMGDKSGKDGSIGGLTTDKNAGKKDEKEDKEKKKQNPVPPKPERKEFTAKDVKGSDTMAVKDVAAALKKMRKEERLRYRKAIIAWRKAKRAIVPEMSNGTKALLRFATMIKNINVDYSENSGTVLPGYMDSTNYFGANMRNRANGLGFALGYQPDQYWLDQQILNNNLSKDSLFNGMMQQRYTQAYNIRAAIEPIREMRIDLNWSSNFTRNQSRINKYDEVKGGFEQINPYLTGTFDMTYIGISTMFGQGKPNEIDATYRNFVGSRTIISDRLGNVNPYTGGTRDPNNQNYTKGYTGFSQDVLIPAFLAAYSGRDANTIPLIQYDQSNIRSNPFRFYFPMPNWRVTYTGLSNLPAFSNIMNSFTLNHNYTGKMSMNSFTNSLLYTDLIGVGFPSFIDSNSNNYVPFFQVPNVTINENFGPFLGFNAAFKNNLTLRVDYGKSRMVSLSLIDYQVSETKSSTFEFGLGYRVRGLRLPFSLFGSRQLKNDLNIKCDIGIRDDVTTNTYIAMNERVATMGQRVISIMPTIDYIINDNLQIQFYFDRKQSNPYVNTSFPLTTTRGGLRLTFTFAGQ